MSIEHWIRLERLDKVKECIDNGADVNRVCQYGYSILILAVADDSIDIVKYLVKRGADVTVNQYR